MPSLNLDVFGTVCAFLTEYPDLLSLSLTCSVLRPLAIQNMLRNRPVVLKKIDTICKFHAFVFSDAAARLPHLIALKVDVANNEIHANPECKARAIEALLAILQRAPSLMSLELCSSADGRLLGYLDDPMLAAAVGELTTLRELTISGRTEVPVDFISAVRAPLTRLALRFTKPGGDLEEWSPTSLGAALSHIAHTLESLTIRDTHFHAVRSLTLNSLVVVPHLPLLLDLFPNLDGTVHLTPFIYEIEITDSADDSERYEFLRRAREQNGTVQERRCWKRLERLICNVETLFVLNLRCPIGPTILHSCSTDSHARRCLVESLRDHPPTHLNLQFDVSKKPSLGGMIPPEAAATMTHLTLCIEYNYKHNMDPTLPPCALRWDDIWRDTLLPAFEHLHCLTHVRLVFHCEAWSRSYRYSFEPEGPAVRRPISEDPLLEDLRPASKFEFAAVASAIVDALPASSLRYCFLTSSAWVADMQAVSAFSVVERWRESRAWRIAPGGPGLSASVDDAEAAATTQVGTRRGREFRLVELHDDVAETIMEREDLILSAEEEASAMKADSKFNLDLR
ncbi:hypothetical protein V8D89_004789 [Ganoderma adspersum]